MLEVDEIVERYETSAAPVYPRRAHGHRPEGMVQAIYVVDTAGRVDTTTIRVLQSDDPRFTAVGADRAGHSRFRPARRAGKTVRQLVEQKFRFKIVPPEEFAKRVS